MHFDQRTQAALREADLSTDEIRAVSESVVETARDDADRLEAFFADRETVYSDMDRAHGAEQFPEHAVEFLDLYTHADEIRGYLRFDTWGVYVAGGRILSEESVELTLGPTVHDRVRFSDSREHL
jgi:alpha-D-ribose 1-methylphosphonate 5-triphosphate diphosphatase PhnM